MKQNLMKKRIPDINSIIDEIMAGYKNDRVGMIASHIGIVRGYSIDGKKVEGLSISFDKKKIKEIEERIRSEDSISEVNVALNEGELLPGDWIMSVMMRWQKDAMNMLNNTTSSQW